MNAGNIGDITVYIKSKEMIDSEENMNRPLDENEDDEYDEGVYVSRQQEEKNNYISELNEHENDNELSSKLNNMNIQENLKVKRVKKLN